MTAQVAIIKTGTSNLASVTAALARLGTTATITDDPDTIATATHAILPGVGALAEAMRSLSAPRLSEAIKYRIADDKPLLAICLGLQMLCLGSEESPGVPGLGILPTQVVRFRDGVTIPQLGWNKVDVDFASRFVTPGYAYYANSYCVPKPVEGTSCGTSEHGQRFVAFVERGNLLAAQFHPELSGRWGLDLLSRWLRGAAC